MKALEGAQMDFVFPDLPKLSLWDLACCLTGQNAADVVPTNATRHKLAELIKAIHDRELWVEWPPGTDFDFISGFISRARTAKSYTESDRQSLDIVTVRREDWAQYIISQSAARLDSQTANTNVDERVPVENHRQAFTATHFVDIPVGTQFLEAADIPNMIAEKLEPIPDIEPTICKLGKSFLIGEKHWKHEELTPEDWKLLDEIWCDLPPVRDATFTQFKRYREVFDAAPNKPEWDLLAEFQNHRGEAQIRQSTCRNEHFRHIDNAIKSGGMHALTWHRAPAASVQPGVIVPIADARIYFKKCGFELRENEKVSSSVILPPTPAIPVLNHEESTPKGLTNQQIMTVFDGIHFISNQSSTSNEKWKKALADPSPWLEQARLQKGTKSRKHLALWDPVQIAAALIDKKVKLAKVDGLFVSHAKILKEWAPVWEEKSEFFR